MTILVTGAKGQLGREAVLALQADGEAFISIGRDELDFSQPAQVAEAIADYSADWVINCAAYTQVDKAEEERELAFTVNRDAARAVAEGVKRSGGHLLHVSTDFIFGGEQSRPYKESDATNPLGVYGQSKLEGEQAIREVLPEALILRTAWVYGAHGHNFVKTILRLAAEREELRVVDDQIGAPSWTSDIVKAMRVLIKNEATGTYQFSNEGVASWYDFAMEIVAGAKRAGFPVVAETIRPIPTEDFPLPAKRPAYSVMSKVKIRGMLDYQIPHWRESLYRMLKQQSGSQA
ncbi:dTDP-4-dehydrorhamnose reductase [Thiogranum longum]|uniref:dTDP-4-dehydrorhamnose reductase n=1 Tax=Thiogranum longum TaxID=1537524 RepID=A0A4R1HFL1_9GAMM|nr:dTDP-4-dehydrorhamnose reductase [Thiogranum longum]TCK19483.1 dTDP-4-dehydrorhamnose reductase [Thiogranum longum]